MAVTPGFLRSEMMLEAFGVTEDNWPDAVGAGAPAEFALFREEGLRRGFKHVESGPLVRSSYHAHEHVPQP